MIGSFLGGPIALIIFAYINISAYQGKKTAIIKCLGISVVYSVYIFLPIDMPRSISLGIGVGLLFAIYQAFLKDDVIKHQESGSKFISTKVATVITILSMSLVAGIIYLDYKRTNLPFNEYAQGLELDFDIELYNQKLLEFYKYENEAIRAQENFYSSESADYNETLAWLKLSTEKWELAKSSIDDLIEINNLPDKTKQQAVIMSEYADLRLIEADLRAKNSSLDTLESRAAIDEIVKQLESKLNQLEEYPN